MQVILATLLVGAVGNLTSQVVLSWISLDRLNVLKDKLFSPEQCVVLLWFSSGLRVGNIVQKQLAEISTKRNSLV